MCTSCVFFLQELSIHDAKEIAMHRGVYTHVYVCITYIAITALLAMSHVLNAGTLVQ